MSKQICNVTVLEGDIWEDLRNVMVTAVDIIRESSLQYQLSPTYKDHDFMRKSGYSKYVYKTWVKKVESLGNDIYQLYDYGFMPSVKIELSNDQLNEWKKLDTFIEFI